MLRDDIIEYAPDQVHSEEDGVAIRKNIWKVTAILSIITIAEVAVGVMFGRGSVSGGVWTTIKLAYIILTVIKARYIILSFMHLGDERASLRKLVLYPYMIFILYLIFIAIQESTYINEVGSLF